MIGLERLPLDIKEGGVFRSAPVLEHVLPPQGVIANAHVVGHDIEEQAHLCFAERCGKLMEASFAAEFRIQAVVADDVVTVLASSASLKNGRAVKVADPQFFEIRENLLCVGECELGVHLHAISRYWGARVAVHHTINAFF